jgi:hypothetical protein
MKTVARRLGVKSFRGIGIGTARCAFRLESIGSAGFFYWGNGSTMDRSERGSAPLSITTRRLPRWSGPAERAPLLSSSPRIAASRIPFPDTPLGRPVVMGTISRRQGGRCQRPRTGTVAPAAAPDLCGTRPGMARTGFPGPVCVRSWRMRVGEWTNRRRDNPALPCDCDLRFSFP